MENFGKYQLIRKLATGGMAEVFLAKSAGPMGFEKTLVLKRILPHLAEDHRFVQMFLAEARLAARLDHPNVVQIFDLGEYQGGYFLAMEYVDGLSLRVLCRKLEKTQLALPPAFCARLICMACEGLAYAHDLRDPETNQWLGIIHRDISPDNLLLSRAGTLKVGDFGLAKAAAVSETRTQLQFGKYWYMAPEQLRRKGALDRRVDIYALGVVLYELLTGKKPFDTDDEVEIMRAILQEQLVPATRRRPDLPPEIDRILGRALAPRDQRYASCQELQGDLEQFIFQSGATMGSQQIHRLIHELGLLPRGSPGAQGPAPMVPLQPTRATPSIDAVERGEIQYTRATPSIDAAERGDIEYTRATPSTELRELDVPEPSAPLPSRPGVGETRLMHVESAAASTGDATRLNLPRVKLSTPEARSEWGWAAETTDPLSVPTDPNLRATRMLTSIPRSRRRPSVWRQGWVWLTAAGVGLLIASLAILALSRR